MVLAKIICQIFNKEIVLMQIILWGFGGGWEWWGGIANFSCLPNSKKMVKQSTIKVIYHFLLWTNLDCRFDMFISSQENIFLLDILFFRKVEQSQQANNIQLYKLQFQTNIIFSYNLQSSGVSYLVSHHSNYHIDVFHVWWVCSLQSQLYITMWYVLLDTLQPHNISILFYCHHNLLWYL